MTPVNPETPEYIRGDAGDGREYLYRARKPRFLGWLDFDADPDAILAPTSLAIDDETTVAILDWIDPPPGVDRLAEEIIPGIRAFLEAYDAATDALLAEEAAEDA